MRRIRIMTPTKHTDVFSRQLSPCTYFSTCVGSRDDAAARHRVEPFVVSGDSAAFFSRLRTLLAALPRTTVLTATEDYLHAICRSRLGFIDDMEFRLHPEGRVVHIRSAARVSLFWDWGVNRRRVERLRAELQSA